MRNRIPTHRTLLAACLGCAFAGATVLAASEVGAQPSPAPIIAVFDIENQGAPLDADTVGRLSNLMFDLLAGAGFKLTPQDQVRQRVIELKRESYRDCYDQSCQIELGKTVAAQKSLSTRLLRIGDSCRLSAALYDLRTETTDRGATAEGPCTETGMAQAVHQVVGRLAASTGTGGGAGALEGVTLDRGEAIVNAPTDRFGFLFVKTDPPGATVFVNGQEKGQSPQQLELPEGRYVVVAEMGRLYHPARQEVALTIEGARLQLDLRPAHGTVKVGSTPRGAEVWLDGEKVGTTPLELPRKPSGTYRLRVQAPDYLADERDLVVADGGVAEHHATLKPNWGTLLVESVPPGAAIVLDEVRTGNVTPHRFDRVRPGVHIVRLALAGHGERSDKANVERGAEAAISVTLDPMLGLLVVTSAYGDGTPCEGDLTLDGRQVGQTPWQGQVLAVAHDVAVRCPGGSGRQVARVQHNARTDAAIQVTGRAPGDEGSRAPRPGAVGGTVGAGGLSGAASGARERAVRVPLSLSVSEGLLRYEGATHRSSVGMGLDLGLRFRGAPWLVPGLGLWWTVESPVTVTLRPGIQWYFGSVPMYVRTALAGMVTPTVAAGFVAGLGADIPLWRHGFLALEATATVWSRTVVPVDFRVGIGHAF